MRKNTPLALLHNRIGAVHACRCVRCWVLHVGAANNDVHSGSKRLLLQFLRPPLQLGEDGELIQSHDETADVTANVHDFNEPAYNYIHIWVRFYQIQDVQHPPPDAEASHVAEQEASFHHNGLDYSGALISAFAI